MADPSVSAPQDLAEDILTLIGSRGGPRCTRMDVVPLYATGLLLECFAKPPAAKTSWAKVNDAIIARWSVSGLCWIKKQAWLRAERKAKELSHG